MCSSIQSKLLSKNYLSEAGLIFQLILSPHSHISITLTIAYGYAIPQIQNEKKSGL